MTKAEIKQKFFDIIWERLDGYEPTAREIKDLAKAFKAVCDTEYDDSLLTELAKTGDCKQKCNGHCKNKTVDDDDGGFGQCD